MLRRRLLLSAAGCVLLAPAVRATPAEVAAAIKAVIGEAVLRPGKVKLDLPVMVENGNAVSMTVSVTEPLGPAQRVVSLHVFAQGNPLPNVAHVRFGPRSAAARFSTRMRLATSQTVIAVAVLADGSCWSDDVELLVTLAACLE